MTSRSPASGRRSPYTVHTLVRNGARFSADRLARLLEGLELGTAREETLLAARLRMAPESRVVVDLPDPTADTPIAIRVCFPDGSLAVDREINDATKLLLGLACSADSVGDAIVQFAASCGADVDEMRPQALELIRSGLCWGLLVAA